MDDAPDEVKAIADYITLDVNHNGLVAAIERLFVVRAHFGFSLRVFFRQIEHSH